MKRTTLALIVSIICIAIAISVIPSCKKSSSTSTPTPKPTLYDSLGGTALMADPANPGTQVEKGYYLIRNIIDSTIFVIAGDDSINVYFKTLLTEVGSGDLSGFEALSKHLSDFVAVGTGAKDYTYTGLSMPVAHTPGTGTGMNPRINGVVSNGAFNEFEVDLVAGAGKAGVPSNTPALVSVAKIVESLRGSVVGQ
jgi:hypothetical protein